MNRQKFLAELSRLLGFMSSWDREAEMNKYIGMLDAAEDEEALIESLGTPTQLAISVALGYKPTPRPGTQPPEPAPAPEPASGPEAAAKPAAEPEREGTPEPAPEPPPPPPPPKKRDELQIVTDGEFEYGMELAILMGEPISAAVESALNGEYLPDPDFSLEEILREARGETDEDIILSESEEAPAENTEEAPAAPEVRESAHPEEKTAPPEPEQTPPAADTDTAEPETAQGNTPEPPVPIAPELPPAEPEGEAAEESAPRTEPVTETETAGDKPAADGGQEAAASGSDEAADKPSGEADETENTKEPGIEAGPVFDAATAPLPEVVKIAGEKAAGTAPSDESADVPETQVNHPPHLVFDPANFAPLPPDEVTEDLQAEEPERPRGALRPAGTAVYVLFALVIGVPLTLLLVLIGVPVMLLGLGAIGAAVYAGTHIIAALSMFSDILLVAGTGVAICALGLLIAWFGLWLSIELGSLWINAVMLRLGRALCFKKEADEE